VGGPPLARPHHRLLLAHQEGTVALLFTAICVNER
jgi:hypothetical protein